MTLVKLARRVVPAIAVAILAVATTVGCSTSDKTTPAASSAVVTTSAQANSGSVSAGLKKIQATAKAIETKVSAGTAVSDAKDQLEVDWKPVEDVVKAKSPSIYAAIEDAFATLDSAAKAKDAAKTTAAAAQLDKAIEDYLKANP